MKFILYTFKNVYLSSVISKMGRIYEYIARTVVDSVFKETK